MLQHYIYITKESYIFIKSRRIQYMKIPHFCLCICPDMASDRCVMVQGFHADIDLHGQQVYMSFHMADLTASPQACCAPLLSKLPLLTVRTHKVTLLHSLHHTNDYTYSCTAQGLLLSVYKLAWFSGTPLPMWKVGVDYHLHCTSSQEPMLLMG